MSEPLKYGAMVKQYRDGLFAVVSADERWWWNMDEWLRDNDDSTGNYATPMTAVVEYRSCNVPPPGYTAPIVEVKPDPWPSLLAKVTDAMSRLCDAAEQFKKERDAAIAERDAARAELKKKEEGK